MLEGWAVGDTQPSNAVPESPKKESPVIIHRQEVRDTYVPNPENRHELILKTVQVPASATHITWSDGRTFAVREDGTFTVPEDVGKDLLRRPGWARGPNPFAPEKPVEESRPKRTRAAV